VAKKPNENGSGPHWPRVEEQLAASKVIQGSELEKLIRNNQDFHMLRPEKAHDKLELPLWLRIYWRKIHPNATTRFLVVDILFSSKGFTNGW